MSSPCVDNVNIKLNDNPQYAFSAARLPGATPDRYVQSEGDEAGVVRGSYAYLDPNYQWQQASEYFYGVSIIFTPTFVQVEYVADSAGFHVAGPVSHPADTAAVSAARLQHAQLYDAIAVRNSQLPVAPLVPAPAPRRARAPGDRRRGQPEEQLPPAVRADRGRARQVETAEHLNKQKYIYTKEIHK